MKKYVGILLSSLLCLGACAPKSESTDSTATKDHAGMDHSAPADKTDAADHANHMSLEAAAPGDQSVYQLESLWNTQAKEEVQLKTFMGSPTVLAMVYSSCKNACPRIISDMKTIQSQVEKSHPGKVQFVLVSMDPEVDTPERLTELAKKSDLDQQWRLLQGKSDDVMELAAVLGVKYRKISETDYAHSNLITVLNADGEIKHREEGLGVDPQKTVEALNQLL